MYANKIGISWETWPTTVLQVPIHWQGLCNAPAFYLDHLSLHIKLHMCIVSDGYYCIIFKNLWTGNLGSKQKRLHKLKMEEQKK